MKFEQSYLFSVLWLTCLIPFCLSTPLKVSNIANVHNELLLDIAVTDRPNIDESPVPYAQFKALQELVAKTSRILCYSLPTHTGVDVSCNGYDEVLGHTNCTVTDLHNLWSIRELNSPVVCEDDGTGFYAWKYQSEIYSARNCNDMPAGTEGIFHFRSEDGTLFDLECFTDATYGSNWSRLPQYELERMTTATCTFTQHINSTSSYVCTLSTSSPTTHCGCGLNLPFKIFMKDVHIETVTQNFDSTSVPGSVFQFTEIPDERAAVNYHYDDQFATCSADISCYQVFRNDESTATTSHYRSVAEGKWGYVHLGMRGYNAGHLLVASISFFFR